MKFNYYLLLLLFFANGVFGKNMEAIKTNQAPIIDGIISAAEWAVQDSAVNFIQLEPSKGSAASEATTVFVMYDDHSLYFAFQCFNSDPSAIVSDTQVRDKIEKSDDAVLVMLDTYRDKRSAFAFLVNALGTQTDMQIFDDGASRDTNWDTQWNTAAKKTPTGWNVEIAIPFSSISFDSKLNSIGINFGRIIRHNSETVYWSGTLNDDYRVSQGGTLSGIEFPQKKHFVTATPYATLRFEDSDNTGNHNKFLTDYGIDASARITSGLTANVTVNPDFATVEADEEEINLTRLESSFPEKRLFFQEGNEMYSTRIQTFYSRRISDIDYGGKISGKINDYNISLISAHSPKNPDAEEPSSTFTAFRVKKDILKSSTIGITAVDKSWSDGFTRSLSADYVLNLGNSWKLTGQWVGSSPGDLLTHSAYFVRIARESNIYHYHLRYSDTGKNFRENVNQTGFVRDDDMQELDADVSYKFWFNNSPIKYLEVETKNNIFRNHAGILRSWKIKEAGRLYFNNRLSLDASYQNEFKLYEKKFYNYEYNLELGYNTDEWASADVEITQGRNFDQDFTLLSSEGQVRLFDKLALTYELNYLKYAKDVSLPSIFINILTANYNFTPNLFLKAFAQNNSEENQFYVYGMFGWRFRPPFGALYLIYTADTKDNTDIGMTEKDKILYLKFSYPITL